MKRVETKSAKLHSLFATVIGVLLWSGGHAIAGDGTLPVRLPGDGTLPALVGEAFDMVGGATSMRASVNFRSLQTEPLQGNVTGPACRMTGAAVTRHAASGSVVVGNLTLSIQGVCFNELTQDLEIVATRPANSASMVGNIQGSLDLARFQGRLVLTQGSGTARYQVDLRNTQNP